MDMKRKFEVMEEVERFARFTADAREYGALSAHYESRGYETVAKKYAELRQYMLDRANRVRQRISDMLDNSDI